MMPMMTQSSSRVLVCLLSSGLALSLWAAVDIKIKDSESASHGAGSLGGAKTPSATPPTAPGDAVRLVETSWLGDNLGRDDPRISAMKKAAVPARTSNHA